MKKIIAYIVFLLFLFLSNPMLGVAQPLNPCPDPKLGDCPIDSNLYLLVVAAIFFAAIKAFYIKNETIKKKSV